jgi:hypothetical protein
VWKEAVKKNFVAAGAAGRFISPLAGEKAISKG